MKAKELELGGIQKIGFLCTSIFSANLCSVYKQKQPRKKCDLGGVAEEEPPEHHAALQTQTQHKHE